MYVYVGSVGRLLLRSVRFPAVPALVARARGPRKKKEKRIIEARPQMTHQYSAAVVAACCCYKR